MKKMRKGFLACVVTLFLAISIPGCRDVEKRFAKREATGATEVDRSANFTQHDYITTIEKWRHDREEKLKAEDGWLTVVGLFWLKEGINSFGTDSSNDIVLPKDSTLPRVGNFELHGGKTTLRVESKAPVKINDRLLRAQELKPDTSGSPDIVTLGSLNLRVIQRGDRYGIRLKDKNSKARQEFLGLHYFPINESLRVSAQFIPYESPKKIAIPTILGTTETIPSPGYVSFKLNGEALHLEPVLEDPSSTSLFFIFRDLTSGKETYPAGRFLYAELPTNGNVILDFNKAVNPPCAFTPYATCPLPPKQNHLQVRIEAGELNYGHK